MKKFYTLALTLLLSACGSGNYNDYLRMYDVPQPTMQNFTHCYDYGCKTRKNISLPVQTQNKLQRLFTPSSRDADTEQKRISQAIKIFEDDIGALTGTENDKRGTFRLYQDDNEKYDSFQQDCIDESTNTTIYLGLLEQMGYLKFHRPVFPANRQPFFSGAPWWHQTAVMENTQTGKKFAVDSWFTDNGHPAFIVPIEEWKDGWLPPKPAK